MLELIRRLGKEDISGRGVNTLRSTPDATRTRYLRFRKPTLYPDELRELSGDVLAQGRWCAIAKKASVRDIAVLFEDACQRHGRLLFSLRHHCKHLYHIHLRFFWRVVH